MGNPAKVLNNAIRAQNESDLVLLNPVPLQRRALASPPALRGATCCSGGGASAMLQLLCALGASAGRRTRLLEALHALVGLVVQALSAPVSCRASAWKLAWSPDRLVARIIGSLG